MSIFGKRNTSKYVVDEKGQVWTPELAKTLEDKRVEGMFTVTNQEKPKQKEKPNAQETGR